MKNSIKLSLKKTKTNLPQFIGLVLLITIGVGFFLTLTTIKLNYEATTKAYFSHNSFANITLKGSFNQDIISQLEKISGVEKAVGRTSQDVRDQGRLFRLISLTEGLNIPHLYEGNFPEKQSECLILRRNAEAMGLKIGDLLHLSGKSYTITGLAASPEYIYLYQNPRTPMAQANSFGVLFLPPSTAPIFNEIVLLTNNRIDLDSLRNTAHPSQIIEQKDHFSTLLYQSDLDQIGSFAYIFPLIFAFLIVAMIAVILSRMVQKDRKQIGILKAIGTKNIHLFIIYLFPFCIVAILGTILGLIAAFLLGNWVISLFGNMFEVPTLYFTFHIGLFSFSLLFAVFICLLSGIFAIAGTAKLLPAIALRPKVPKKGKKILLERFDFWQRFSFNTRYTIKGLIKGKWRLLVVVLGMISSCALMAFSLGFSNSITYTLKQHIEHFAQYDIIIDLDPTPLQQASAITEKLDKSYKALTLPVKIQNDETILVLTEADFDMVTLPKEKLHTGMIIPLYFAEKWGKKVGDELEIDNYKGKISAIIPQVMGLNIFTSFEYLESIDPTIPKIYNTIYGQSHDMDDLTAQLKQEGITYSTKDDDKQSFETIMKSLDILILFLIVFSIILGVVVLYSVGLISLSSKEFEYMFMSIMGYGRGKVFAANAKETLLQLMIALPLGCVSANLLLQGIKGEFSTDNFVMQPFIQKSSYIVAVVSVFTISLIMAIITDRKVNALDIVEGLKSQED